MAFDLASVLKNVSIPDTASKEVIEYIPLEQIDPDPLNFYSLTELDALAESIELLGLQQPLRVRSGENGHVTVVSGHRRRAAIAMIADGGNDMFAGGIPCIRERKEGSAALNELALIYANSASRVLSSAEISKQAERVTELLYQLKEEGVEFPGRMREHVAQACNISATKLARLHAIRENLIEGLLKHFDDGSLSETAAYELQKLPPELQQSICLKAQTQKNFFIPADSAKNCVDAIEEYTSPKTCEHSAAPCEHVAARFALSATGYSWNNCTGTCCCDCYRMESCGQRCRYAAAEKLHNKKKVEEARQAADRRLEKQKKENAAAIQAEAQRLVTLIDKAGLEDTDYLSGINRNVYQIRSFASGDFGKYDTSCSSSILPHYLDGMNSLTKQLHCSLDHLYNPDAVSSMDTSEPVSTLDTSRYVMAEPAKRSLLDSDTVPQPRWFTGEPPFDGAYVCTVSIAGNPCPARQSLVWQNPLWRVRGSFKPIDSNVEVTGWWPVPEI